MNMPNTTLRTSSRVPIIRIIPLFAVAPLGLGSGVGVYDAQARESTRQGACREGRCPRCKVCETISSITDQAQRSSVWGQLCVCSCARLHVILFTKRSVWDL
jgi:hypothetical protein